MKEMKPIVLYVLFLTYALQLNAQAKFPKHIDEHLREASVNHAIKNGLPLCFIDVDIVYDTAGTSLLKLFSQNVTKKNIDTYTIEVYCYGEDNEPVNHDLKNTNVFVGISQVIKPSLSNVYFPDIWALDGYDNTTKVDVYLIKVHFWDGTSWTPKDKRVTLIESDR